MNKETSIGSMPRQVNVRLYLFKALETLLYSNVFISCCAFFLAAETYLLAGMEVSLPITAFIFLSTLFTYNLSSIQSAFRHPQQPAKKQDQPWNQRNKKFLAILGAVSIVLASAIFFLHGLRLNLWFILHLGVLSVGYTVPIIHKKKRVAPLRSVPLLKVFLIAYVWAAVTTLFPLMDAGRELWEAGVLQLFLRRFLFIGALALLFDIRDYSYDKHKKTLTFPGLLGIRNTKLLSLSLLLLYMLLALKNESGTLLLALFLSAVAAAAIVVFSSEERPRIYYALLADGAMLVHAGLVFAAFS